MRRPFPLKIVPSHGGIWTPSNTYFPGPTRVLNPNSSSISSVIFAWLTSVTDRPTDRPLYCLKMISKMTERDKKAFRSFNTDKTSKQHITRVSSRTQTTVTFGLQAVTDNYY